MEEEASEGGDEVEDLDAGFLARPDMFCEEDSVLCFCEAWCRSRLLHIVRNSPINDLASTPLMSGTVFDRALQ